MSARSEKMLLVANDEINKDPKEEWGSNRGPLVDQYLRAAGLDPTTGHYPWCASFVTFCAKKAGYDQKKGELPTAPAAVRNWVDWARAKRDNGKDNFITTDVHLVKRGDLGCWLKQDLTGHIFMINEVAVHPDGTYWVRTSEGNTEPTSLAGDPKDREGDGAYKKWRRVDPYFKFILMSEL